ncbi:hypothetical protein ACWIUD_09510 [Helicobacter sp. 23-1044]
MRGARSEASATKQSKKNNNMDCHDLTSSNLAMTDFFTLDSAKIAIKRRISQVTEKSQNLR